MKAAWIVTTIVLASLLLAAGAMWVSVKHWAEFAAEYGPDITVNVAARAQQAAEKLSMAKDAYSRWLALGDVALWKAQPPTEEESRLAANELMALLEAHRDDWNYGNAVHQVNSALGRLALAKGDKAAARAYLIASVNSAGSPQMNSFGPNMVFAKEMLDAGEKVAVLEYLHLCRKFWSLEKGRLRVWERMIGEGCMPKFGANLLY